jgi:phage shock protein PspC (stress-responsive transcriptional regulator)
MVPARVGSDSVVDLPTQDLQMSSPPPPAAPRRVTRLRHGRLIGGVARGLARYLGIDPVVVRIAFVVLAFVPFPGFGLLVYLAMLLLVPEEDADGAVAPTRTTERTPAFWVGIGLVGLATFALLGVVNEGRPGFLVPLLLIGLGVALWVDADRRPSRGTTAASVAPTASSWHPPMADEGGASTAPGTATPVGAPPPAPPDPTGPAWTPPPVRPRERSPLGRVTLGLALLAGGTAWLLDLLEVVEVPIASMLAVVLLVLGLGLLVGSFLGRARWLAAVAALVLPFALVATVLDDLGIDVSGGVGERQVVVTSASQLDQPVTMGAGELRIDLTGLPEDALDDVVLDASLGAGELRVIVPEGVGLDGRMRLEVGEARLIDQTVGGLDVALDVDVVAEPGQPTLTLDLRAGVGEIRVSTADPASTSGTDGATTDEATTDQTPEVRE